MLVRIDICGDVDDESECAGADSAKDRGREVGRGLLRFAVEVGAVDIVGAAGRICVGEAVCRAFDVDAAVEGTGDLTGEGQGLGKVRQWRSIAAGGESRNTGYEADEHRSESMPPTCRFHMASISREWFWHKRFHATHNYARTRLSMTPIRILKDPPMRQPPAVPPDPYSAPQKRVPDAGPDLSDPAVRQVLSGIGLDPNYLRARPNHSVPAENMGRPPGSVPPVGGNYEGAPQGIKDSPDWTYEPPKNAGLAQDLPYWIGGIKGVPDGATVKLPGGTTVTRDPSDDGTQTWRIPGVPTPWRRLPDAPDSAFFGETGINAQPRHGSSSPGIFDKTEFEFAYNFSLWWFRMQNEPLAIDVLSHYLQNTGTGYEFSPEQMDRIIHSPWVRNVIHDGQKNDHTDPGHPTRSRGLSDEIRAAVEQARSNPDLYGRRQEIVVPWMSTTAAGEESDQADTHGTGHDVHDALGNFHLGATGTVVVQPPKADGSVDYEVLYNIKAWDYEKFNYLSPEAHDQLSSHPWKVDVNNTMRDAHTFGLAWDYADHGTSAQRVRSGRLDADGKGIDEYQDGYVSPAPGMTQDALIRDPTPKAAGGEVRGPGSSIGDKIPAWLSDGEFVMNAKSTEMNRPFLQALNQDPYFLQKLMAQRGEQRRPAGSGALGSAAPAGQPATVNISLSSQEDVVGRLKLLSAQWELLHSH
ncbi:hypothetical protein [Nocardia nepalensis]|uniref:hypothetical protein n=1 Tax=Nocardia nepalensis TaxID=3375448 RepID=UPI003B675097